jgi:hypothetical protein
MGIARVYYAVMTGTLKLSPPWLLFDSFDMLDKFNSHLETPSCGGYNHYSLIAWPDTRYRHARGHRGKAIPLMHGTSMLQPTRETRLYLDMPC